MKIKLKLSAHNQLEIRIMNFVTWSSLLLSGPCQIIPVTVVFIFNVSANAMRKIIIRGGKHKILLKIITRIIFVYQPFTILSQYDEHL